MNSINLWQLLGGLGMFLYGMFQMEEALKEIAGRAFKLFLRKHTERKLEAILSGTLITGILQSSSIVILMVLAFVGAGIISMRNALGIVFGSNLGTTLSSWIVAALGFKFDIEVFALPIIALAVFGLTVFNKNKKIIHLSKFFIGFGLLFIGLNLMKESVESFVHAFDFSPYLNYNRLVFVIIGFAITALIQSSLATMVITLSALHTGVFPFETAVAIIIGSELGTSLKISLGSIGGIASKKRLALGNLIFNFIITVFAFVLMFPIITLITDNIGVKDPLMALVLFQSIINLSGVILFYPILALLGDFLEKRFSDSEQFSTFFIKRESALIPEVALEAMEKETALFIYRVIYLNIESFHLEYTKIENKLLNDIIDKKNLLLNTYPEKYIDVKQAEGEILSYYFKIGEEKIEKEDHKRLDQLIIAVRNAMYSAKGFKDVYQDRLDFRNTVDNVKYEQYKLFQSQLNDFYIKLISILNLKEKGSYQEELKKILELANKNYDIGISTIYKHGGKNILEEVDISTLLNVNRRLHSSCRAIVFSLKDFLLDAVNAENFGNNQNSK